MIRCLIVDDSRTFRAVLRDILGRAPGVQVVAEAADGDEALARTLELRPDVITMDARMPRMDGLSAIREIMYQAPTPIIVVSAESEAVSFEALQLGAIEVVAKPRGSRPERYERDAEAIRMAVRAVAGLKLVTRRRPPSGSSRTSSTAIPVRTDPPAPYRPPETPALTPLPIRIPSIEPFQPPCVIGVASSTGGPQALCRILVSLPETYKIPILVVQHIADGFDTGLVKWLDSETAVHVKLAEQGEPLVAGTVYFGPNGRHLTAHADRIRLDDGPPMRGFKPSGTVLLASLAASYGSAAGGLVLSGMGEDGAAGLRHLRDRGGFTAAQGPATSVVYGMPRVAWETGAAAHSLELDEISGMFLRLAGLR
jgi:two-component system chemotaxis response regulator CheB